MITPWNWAKRVGAAIQEAQTTFDNVCFALEKVLDHLEATEEYKTSHGVHFDAVEARKLLESLRA
jgi:hypothetical protein